MSQSTERKTTRVCASSDRSDGIQDCCLPPISLVQKEDGMPPPPPRVPSPVNLTKMLGNIDESVEKRHQTRRDEIMAEILKHQSAFEEK